MTDEQKRQQKAMLLLECNEAEQHLRHLERKAKQLQEALEAIAGCVRKAFEAKHSSETLRVVVDFQGNKYEAKDRMVSEAMDHADFLQLLQDLADARMKYDSLKEQKQQFGLI